MLKFHILTGELQGEEISLFEGMTLGKSGSHINLGDDVSFDFQAQIIATSGGQFALKAPSALIQSGVEQKKMIDLLPGVFFTIGDVGFSVQENLEESSHVPEGSKIPLSDFLKEKVTGFTPPLEHQKEDFLPIEGKVLFRFVRGPLIQETWKILWSPMTFGSHSSLYFFVDSNIPTEVDFLALSYIQKKNGEALCLTSSLENFVQLNGEPLSFAQEVSDGDFVEFGQTAFYIDVL